MTGFVGRKRELADLDYVLEQVRNPTSDRPGKAIALRGRRRVGKSRLVTEFVERAGVPSLYFLADGSRPELEQRRLLETVAASGLPGADAAGYAVSGSWQDALTVLALALPTDRVSIIVLDEVSYLTGDPGFEGALQGVWDTRFSALPVLLVLVGSNQSGMERLTSHGRPFYGRSVDKEILPLTPQDVATMTGLDAAPAIDAYLVTGGLPPLVTAWRRGQSVADYLADGLSTSISTLVVSGERVLSSEFPSETQAKDVLRAIGADARTFTAIGQAAQVDQRASLSRSLDQLVERRVVAVDEPLSTKPAHHKQYRIDDPYMRFWLAFLHDAADLIDAGRGDIVTRRIERGWSTWRGRAVEPVVRRLLWERALDDDVVPASAVVGGWWNRKGDVEVDLVGADRRPAKTVTFIGSIKWRETAPFDLHDATELVNQRSVVPGADQDAPLIAASRSGGSIDGITILTPADLLG
ncbi:ATP-binding protein [Cellulosimicrobium sp. 22601]|uniref:ATP-binding protein n=1 Tax=unclassified Cellulosimicrobium TaxID=2624466 RepID=UPI003F87FAE7